MSERSPLVRAMRRYRPVATLLLILYWFGMLAATHTPKIPAPLDPGTGDKLVHKLGYLALGFGVGIVVIARRGGLGWGRALAAWGVIAAYAVLDELTQPLVGRSAELEDWYADLQGAAVGLLAALLCEWIFRHWPREHQPPQEVDR